MILIALKYLAGTNPILKSIRPGLSMSTNCILCYYTPMNVVRQTQAYFKFRFTDHFNDAEEASQKRTS